jgi:hypothetical protein
VIRCQHEALRGRCGYRFCSHYGSDFSRVEFPDAPPLAKTELEKLVEPEIELAVDPPPTTERAPGPHDELVETVAVVCLVTAADIYSRDRHQQNAHARHLCALLLRERGLSFPEIGRVLGGRDHTTAMSAVARAQQLELTDRATRERLDKIRAALQSSLPRCDQKAECTDSLAEQLAELQGTAAE